MGEVFIFGKDHGRVPKSVSPYLRIVCAFEINICNVLSDVIVRFEQTRQGRW